ncbi:HTH_Tnp_Tc3_2 domain-containing protein [Trichonephila clavipes]|nr:HTH_Tnp_Tc3_2 domain-containing protein [Trichonephila clavipes]
MPLRRNRRQYGQLTEFDKGPYIRPQRSSGSQKVECTVAFEESGRPRNTNDPCEDRFNQKSGTSAPTTSLHRFNATLYLLPDIQCHQRNHKETTDRSWLEGRRPLRRLPLTPHHRQCRLDFCRPRAAWSVTDWRRVIFRDESIQSVMMTTPHTCLEAHRPAVRSRHLLSERHTAISQGVTVWGAISWDTRSSLMVLQGTLTARDTWTIF